MGDKQIHSKKGLKELCEELRHNLTPAEAFLWKQLKARKLQGRRFIKQHSIGNYIVDFYCAQEQLIIELDGEVHNNSASQEYDLKRTQFLNSLGYTVIRFENKMVFDFLPSVLKEITENFNIKS